MSAVVFGSVDHTARPVTRPTRDQFTDDQRAALVHAHGAAQRELRRDLMERTEAFCMGSDDLAERWDGHVARSTMIVAELDRLTDTAYGVGS